MRRGDGSTKVYGGMKPQGKVTGTAKAEIK